MKVLTERGGIKVTQPNLIERVWRSLKHGIRNLIYWGPVIWRDRNWDDYFMWVLFRHKFAAMAKDSRHWMSVEREERTDELLVMVKLCDDLIHNAHEKTAFRDHERIFGEAKWEFIPYSEDPDLAELKITYPDSESQEQATEALRAFSRMAQMARTITLEAVGRGLMLSERWWD